MRVKTKTWDSLTNQSGMTLIEIMVVLLILAGIIGILVPNVTQQLNKADQRTTEIKLGRLAEALQTYRLDCKRFPEELSALLENPGEDECKNWGPEPYTKSAQLVDSWDNELIYKKINSSKFSLYSLGADGDEGGEALDKDIYHDKEQAE